MTRRQVSASEKRYLPSALAGRDPSRLRIAASVRDVVADVRRQRETFNGNPPRRSRRATRSQFQGLGCAGDEQHRFCPRGRYRQQAHEDCCLASFSRSRTDTPREHAIQALDGVYVSANRELLRELLGRDKPMDGLRIFIGHSGWAPGQLEAEIARGDWTLAPAEKDAIFNGKSEHPWPAQQTPGAAQGS